MGGGGGYPREGVLSTTLSIPCNGRLIEQHRLRLLPSYSYCATAVDVEMHLAFIESIVQMVTRYKDIVRDSGRLLQHPLLSLPPPPPATRLVSFAQNGLSRVICTPHFDLLNRINRRQ